MRNVQLVSTDLRRLPWRAAAPEKHLRLVTVVIAFGAPSSGHSIMQEED